MNFLKLLQNRFVFVYKLVKQLSLKVNWFILVQMNQTINLVSLARPFLRPRCIIPNSAVARSIHKFERPRIYSLQTRKKEEEEDYPRPNTPRFSHVEWNYNSEIYAFGRRIGENFNEDILRQAFTDKSYVVEQMKKQEDLGLEAMEMRDNEYLSTEGRSLLYKTLGALLKQQFPKLPVIGIESIVNYLMSDSVLSNISSLIGTKDLILSNEYPPTEEILTRTFLAIIASAEKSSGIESAQKFIEHFVLTNLCEKDINEIWDIPKPWVMLTNIMNQKGEVFEPRLLRESGKNTLLSVFVVGLYDSKKQLVGTGVGETIDIAQEMAARDALTLIFDTKNAVYKVKFDEK